MKLTEILIVASIFAGLEWVTAFYLGVFWADAPRTLSSIAWISTEIAFWIFLAVTLILEICNILKWTLDRFFGPFKHGHGQ